MVDLQEKDFGAEPLRAADGLPGEAVGLQAEVVSREVVEVLVAVEAVGGGRSVHHLLEAKIKISNPE